MEQKKLILPVGIESAFQILGSKVGFIEFCKKHSIPHPKTQVFKSKEQLQKFGSTFVSPMVVKGDTGAGGENVFRLNNKKDLLDYLEADINFPLILQENIASKLYSVEAFFQDGQLCGWMFSEIEELVSEFGVSIARTYLNPKDRSFTEILCKFGKSTGANGFASCGFFIQGNVAIFYLRPICDRMLGTIFSIHLEWISNQSMERNLLKALSIPYIPKIYQQMV